VLRQISAQRSSIASVGLFHFFDIVLRAGAQPALHFGGGQLSWNFIWWRHLLIRTWYNIFANGHR